MSATYPRHLQELLTDAAHSSNGDAQLPHVPNAHSEHMGTGRCSKLEQSDRVPLAIYLVTSLQRRARGMHAGDGRRANEYAV